MHFSNERRQEFLDAVETCERGHGSAPDLLKAAQNVRGCTDIVPSAYRGISHEVMGGEAPAFTFDEAAERVITSVGA